MIRTKKFENLPQITTISPSGKIVITENGVDKVISFEDFSNLPPATEIWDNPSTTFTASEINVTDIQSAADSKLLDLKVNTSSKFVVRKDGNLGIGVANPAARLDISDTVLAGSGSLAGSILNLAQTWNTNGAPTAIKLNVTNTTSGATSNLLDLQVGGLTQFNVTKAGIIILNDNFGLRGVPSSGWIEIGGKTNILTGTSKVSIWEHILGLVQLANNGSFGWSSLSYASNGSTDLALSRDAAGTLAQRNGVNPQAFRLYNTYTSSTNFERLNLRWDSNILKIGTEKGGAGGTARNLGFETDGTTRMTITSTGLVGIGTTNPAASLDIQGASSGIFLGRSDSEKYIYIVTSPSTGYTANSFAIWNGITAAWAGLIMQFTENAALIFNRDITSAYTQIRGANASEPALTLTQNSTGDFFAAGTFRLSKSGNLGIGNTVPAARLDIVDTWNSNISVTGATGTGSVATITFATQSTVIPVGATVVVSSVNPSGYNGTFVVTASSVTSVSYANATSTAYISGGTVQQLFTAVKVNVTDTASAVDSNLLDLQVGGSSKFKIDKTGRVRVLQQLNENYNISSFGDNSYNTGLSLWGNDVVGIISNGVGIMSFKNSYGALIKSNLAICWGNVNINGGADLFLYRDTSNTLAQRNGVNPQVFRLYGTYTDASNYARLAISCDNSGNAILATEGLGTGAAGTISIGNSNKIILGTSAGVDLAFRATDSTSVGFRIGSGNTLEIVRSDAGAYANITANNITIQGTLSTLYAAINSNVNVAPTTGEHVALIASSSSNGTAANGFGTRIVLRTESSTTAARDSGAISSLWSDATDATRTSDLLFYNALNGTLTERMRILGSNGNVGIGTATPSVKLHIEGNSNPTTLIRNTSTTGYSQIIFANTVVTNTGFWLNGSAQSDYGGLNSLNGYIGAGVFAFHTASVTNAFTLLQNGNLGIGTLTPSTKLEIVTTGTVDGLKLNRAADDRTAWLVDEGTGSGALYLFNGSNSNSVYITGNGNSYINSGNLGLGMSGGATAKLDIADTTLAGSGSLAGSILNLAQTWNTTGAPTAIKLNVTNTASGAASNLLDLQVGGSSVFTIKKSGQIVGINGSEATPTYGFFDSNWGTGFSGWYKSADMIACSVAGGTQTAFSISHVGLKIANAIPLGWSASTGLAALDTILLRDGAAGTLAQRNGINAQTFRLYNTYTDATTFERLNIKWDTNVLKIGTEKGSVGGGARNLAFETDATTRMTVTSAGDVGISTSTPQNKLDVNGDTRLGGWLHIDRTGGSITSYLALRSRGASEAGNFGNAAGNGQFEINAINVSGLVIGTNNSPLILATTQAERLRITAAGLVGIGTTSPRGALDISSSNASGLWSYLQNTNSGSYSAFAVGNNISASRFVIYTLGSTYPSTGQYQANHTLMEATGDLFFKATKHIFYSGNVGIGTTTPTNLLHLYSEAQTGAAQLLVQNDTDTTVPIIQFLRRRSSGAAVLNRDSLGRIMALGSKSSTVNLGAGYIEFQANASPEGYSNVLPSKINFVTFVNDAYATYTNSLINGAFVSGGTTGQFIFNKNDNIAGDYGPDTGLSRLGIGIIGIGNATAGSSGGTLIAGSVGIGTTTPASKLTVTGGDIEITDVTGGVIFKTPDGTKRYRMTIDNAGAPVFTLLA